MADTYAELEAKTIRAPSGVEYAYRDLGGNGQRLIEGGHCVVAVSALDQLAAQVFEGRRVGERSGPCREEADRRLQFID